MSARKRPGCTPERVLTPAVGQVIGQPHEGGIVIRILAVEPTRLDAEIQHVGSFWAEPARMAPERPLEVGQKVGLRFTGSAGKNQYWWVFEGQGPWFVLYYDYTASEFKFEHYR